MAADDILNIVDENDVIIGTASRKEIHKEGLLHREVHIVFVTPSGDIIFQRRGKNKDSYPDKLDVTVGGHVEIGDDYIAAALREAEEETGLILSESDLIPIDKIRSDVRESLMGVRNNRFSQVYAYIFKGKLSDLQVEIGKAEGFEAFPGKDIFNLQQDVQNQFIHMLVDPDALYAPIYQKTLALVQK